MMTGATTRDSEPSVQAAKMDMSGRAAAGDRAGRGGGATDSPERLRWRVDACG